MNNYRYLYGLYKKANTRSTFWNKYAAAILTPEAEQAAMQPPPQDPSMAGGMPPQGGAPMDPAMMGGAPQGGMPQQAAGPNGGEIPPEILQDQMFLQFLAQTMGIQFDPNSGTFIDPNGQPVPADMIMQAYQAYMQQAQQQGMPPQEGAPMDPSMMGGAPMDPAAAGGMPPQEGAPMDPSMMGGAAMDPSMAGQQPAAMEGSPDMGQGGDPLQDQEFMTFLQTTMGISMDPNTGMLMDQQGNQIPMEMIQQLYPQYQQQLAQYDQNNPAPEQGAPMDPAMADAGMSPDAMQQQDVVKVVEETLKEYTASIDKKISTLLDKIESLTNVIDAMNTADDRRAQKDKDTEAELREELAADLQPTVKTAATKSAPAPINMFSLIRGR